VQVPVILVNKNRTPKVMEAILNSTQIEYFALARSLLRQLDLVNIWEKDAEHISNV
jgi:2,4-dienoyl-CoA reductase-like NADH-dependent reductase (Old Yellow Enzyme family)